MGVTTGVAGPAMLAAGGSDLASHTRVHGPLPRPGRALIDLTARSGLTGRGGAGFPTGRKLAAVAAGRRPVVVANVAEGEPASRKDAALTDRAPHLVLDGLQLAADATGAVDVYAYVSTEAGYGRIERALAERSTAGTDLRPVTLLRTPEGFVSGEESAVVAAVEGRPALPAFRRRLVVEAGVHGRPTLVQNAETLAHLALIARHGPAWFRGRGTAAEPGTYLATVSGAVRSPGVLEVAHGTELGQVLELAGGAAEPLCAVLVGGYHGAWVPMPDGMRAPASRAGLRAWDASPGAGVLIALGAARCGLALTAQITGYLASAGARQCGPCRNGLPMLAGTLQTLAGGRGGPHLAEDVEQLARLVDGRGACRHPDGTVRLVRSALRTFAPDVRAHLAGGCACTG